jgi:hypothetical protein
VSSLQGNIPDSRSKQYGHIDELGITMLSGWSGLLSLSYLQKMFWCQSIRGELPEYGLFLGVGEPNVQRDIWFELENKIIEFMR